MLPVFIPQERNENNGDSASTAAGSTEALSPQHFADRDVTASDQSRLGATSNEEQKTQSETNRDNGGEYDRLDSCEVEEARRRAQQPSVYEGLQWCKCWKICIAHRKGRNVYFLHSTLVQAIEFNWTAKAPDNLT